MVTTKRPRTATIQVQQQGKARATITAYVPSNIRAPEFEKINKVIVEKVIKGLTGCPCLSGLADVIYKDDLADSINVELGG
jgi:hypothetical protein